jgi:hypothetical protein
MYLTIYHTLGCSIYDTNRTVLRALWKKLKRVDRRRRDKRKSRHGLYRGVLKCHADALELARHFRL